MDNDSAVAAEGSNRLETLKESATTVMASVNTSGVIHLVQELGVEIEHDISSRRRWGCWLMSQFCKHANADFLDYVAVILKYLLSRVADLDRLVLVAVMEALGALCDAAKHDCMMDHVDFIRSCISSTASDSKHRRGMDAGFKGTSGEFLLPLFTVPSSLDALLPMLSHTLMNGNATQRESAAAGIGELAAMTDDAVLKPYLIKTAGPLIRVIGDRFPSSVKLAILQVCQRNICKHLSLQT